MEAEKERELQEKVLVYQIMQRHMEELGQTAMMLDKRYAEIEAAKEAFEDIAKLKEKNEVLIPIGNGIFSNGKITETQKFLVEVGAGILVEKDPESARKFLDEKKNEIEKLAEELQAEINDTSEKMNSLVAGIEKEAQENQADHLPSSHAGKHHKKPKQD